MLVNTLDMQSLHSTTLPETNSSHLKLDGWNTRFLLGWPMFRGYVSLGEGIVYNSKTSGHSQGYDAYIKCRGAKIKL